MNKWSQTITVCVASCLCLKAYASQHQKIFSSAAQSSVRQYLEDVNNKFNALHERFVNLRQKLNRVDCSLKTGELSLFRTLAVQLQSSKLCSGLSEMKSLLKTNAPFQKMDVKDSAEVSNKQYPILRLCQSRASQLIVLIDVLENVEAFAVLKARWRLWVQKMQDVIRGTVGDEQMMDSPQQALLQNVSFFVDQKTLTKPEQKLLNVALRPHCFQELLKQFSNLESETDRIITLLRTALDILRERVDDGEIILHDSSVLQWQNFIMSSKSFLLSNDSRASTA